MLGQLTRRVEVDHKPTQSNTYMLFRGHTLPLRASKHPSLRNKTQRQRHLLRNPWFAFEMKCHSLLTTQRQLKHGNRKHAVSRRKHSHTIDDARCNQYDKQQRQTLLWLCYRPALDDSASCTLIPSTDASGSPSLPKSCCALSAAWMGRHIPSASIRSRIPTNAHSASLADSISR